jgi:sugar lactone lactonase YvrE
VDSKRVYIADNVNDQVLAIPIGGGAAVVVASDPRPVRLAVSETAVYWTSQYGGVRSAALDGGAVTTIASQTGDETSGIALDSSHVYWTVASSQSEGAVRSAPLDGGPATTIASGQDDPVNLAIAASAAYWINDDIYATSTGGGCLMTASLDGGAPVTLSPWVNLGGVDVVVDDVNVYWVQSGLPDGGDSTGLFRMPLAGGPTTLLGASGGELAIDRSYVYWADGAANAIMKLPVDGGAPTKVASSISLPMHIAVDGTSVYWTDFQGVVLKARK